MAQLFHAGLIMGGTTWHIFLWLSMNCELVRCMSRVWARLGGAEAATSRVVPNNVSSLLYCDAEHVMHTSFAQNLQNLPALSPLNMQLPYAAFAPRFCPTRAPDHHNACPSLDKL